MSKQPVLRDTAKGDRIDLKDKIKDLTLQLDDRKQVNVLLNAENQRLKRSLGDLQKQYINSEKGKWGPKGEAASLTAMRAVVADALGSTADAHANYSAAAEHNASLLDQVASLNQLLLEAQAEAETCQDALEKSDKKIGFLEKQLQDSKAEVATLEEKATRLAEKNDALTKKVNEFLAHIAEMETTTRQFPALLEAARKEGATAAAKEAESHVGKATAEHAARHEAVVTEKNHVAEELASLKQRLSAAATSDAMPDGWVFTEAQLIPSSPQSPPAALATSGTTVAQAATDNDVEVLVHDATFAPSVMGISKDQFWPLLLINCPGLDRQVVRVAQDSSPLQILRGYLLHVSTTPESIDVIMHQNMTVECFNAKAAVLGAFRLPVGDNASQVEMVVAVGTSCRPGCLTAQLLQLQASGSPGQAVMELGVDWKAIIPAPGAGGAGTLGVAPSKDDLVVPLQAHHPLQLEAVRLSGLFEASGPVFTGRDGQKYQVWKVLDETQRRQASFRNTGKVVAELCPDPVAASNPLGSSTMPLSAALTAVSRSDRLSEIHMHVLKGGQELKQLYDADEASGTTRVAACKTVRDTVVASVRITLRLHHPLQLHPNTARSNATAGPTPESGPVSDWTRAFATELMPIPRLLSAIKAATSQLVTQIITCPSLHNAPDSQAVRASVELISTRSADVAQHLESCRAAAATAKEGEASVAELWLAATEAWLQQYIRALRQDLQISLEIDFLAWSLWDPASAPYPTSLPIPRNPSPPLASTAIAPHPSMQLSIWYVAYGTLDQLYVSCNSASSGTSPRILVKSNLAKHLGEVKAELDIGVKRWAEGVGGARGAVMGAVEAARGALAAVGADEHVVSSMAQSAVSRALVPLMPLLVVCLTSALRTVSAFAIEQSQEANQGPQPPLPPHLATLVACTHQVQAACASIMSADPSLVAPSLQVAVPWLKMGQQIRATLSSCCVCWCASSVASTGMLLLLSGQRSAAVRLALDMLKLEAERTAGLAGNVLKGLKFSKAYEDSVLEASLPTITHTMESLFLTCIQTFYMTALRLLITPVAPALGSLPKGPSMGHHEIRSHFGEGLSLICHEHQGDLALEQIRAMILSDPSQAGLEHLDVRNSVPQLSRSGSMRSAGKAISVSASQAGALNRQASIQSRASAAAAAVEAQLHAQDRPMASRQLSRSGSIDHAPGLDATHQPATPSRPPSRSGSERHSTRSLPVGQVPLEQSPSSRPPSRSGSDHRSVLERVEPSLLPSAHQPLVPTRPPSRSGSILQPDLQPQSNPHPAQQTGGQGEPGLIGPGSPQLLNRPLSIFSSSPHINDLIGQEGHMPNPPFSNALWPWRLKGRVLLLGAHTPGGSVLGAQTPDSPVMGAQTPGSQTLGPNTPRSPVPGSHTPGSPGSTTGRGAGLGAHGAVTPANVPRVVGDICQEIGWQMKVLEEYHLDQARPDIDLPHLISSDIDACIVLDPKPDLPPLLKSISDLGIAVISPDQIPPSMNIAEGARHVLSLVFSAHRRVVNEAAEKMGKSLRPCSLTVSPALFLEEAARSELVALAKDVHYRIHADLQLLQETYQVVPAMRLHVTEAIPPVIRELDRQQLLLDGALLSFAPPPTPRPIPPQAYSQSGAILQPPHASVAPSVTMPYAQSPSTFHPMVVGAMPPVDPVYTLQVSPPGPQPPFYHSLSGASSPVGSFYSAAPSMAPYQQLPSSRPAGLPASVRAQSMPRSPPPAHPIANQTDRQYPDDDGASTASEDAEVGGFQHVPVVAKAGDDDSDAASVASATFSISSQRHR